MQTVKQEIDTSDGIESMDDLRFQMIPDATSFSKCECLAADEIRIIVREEIQAAIAPLLETLQRVRQASGDILTHSLPDTSYPGRNELSQARDNSNLAENEFNKTKRMKRMLEGDQQDKTNTRSKRQRQELSPATNVEELNLLVQNELFVNRLKYHCSNNGSSNITNIVKRLLRLMMVRDLALKFSYSGLGKGRQRGKLVFKDHEACRLIIDTLKERTDADLNEIVLAIQRSLRSAVDWDGGRVRRKSLQVNDASASNEGESTRVDERLPVLQKTESRPIVRKEVQAAIPPPMETHQGTQHDPEDDPLENCQSPRHELSPATTVEELNLLVENELIVDHLKYHCTNCINDSERARKLLKLLMTQELAMSFSYTGLKKGRQKGKMAFKDHKACLLIMDILQESTDADYNELVLVIQRNLRYAAFWEGVHAKKSLDASMSNEFDLDQIDVSLPFLHKNERFSNLHDTM